jgi:hypothetical protein
MGENGGVRIQHVADFFQDDSQTSYFSAQIWQKPKNPLTDARRSEMWLRIFV